MSNYCIGIDTGGTFTDAVLLETSSRKVIHWAKRPTTHHDLSIGVGEVLEAILPGNLNSKDVSGLSVSTTLATNAVVEGHGARVGLVVFGPVRHFKLPVVANIFLKGGHTITGEEEQPLDMEDLVDTIQTLSSEVDAYAVCGSMSIKNPTHELVAEKAISMIDPKPVFCSHQVSSHPGMLERSATACLHAKLMPLMVDFLASIQRSMLGKGLNCPVTIICGNGSGAGLDETVERAATTMASGPAATARFGAATTADSALIVDIGGTTTDICMVQDGKPVMNKEGCRIGQWQTHVDAIDMYTAAGGGDSQVVCQENGAIALQPNRVQPLAMTADLPDPVGWLQPGLDSLLVMPVAGLERKTVDGDALLSFLDANGPAPPSSIAEATSVSGIILEKRLERLVFQQQVTLVGFTPTDALHALGRLAIGDVQAARKGAESLAVRMGLSARELCSSVIGQAETAMEAIILNFLGRHIWDGQQAVPLLNQRENEFFTMHFSLKLPLIGIGAAARYFLPEVARRLGTTVTFPEYYEVGNAIGAALIGLENRDQ